VAADAAVVPEAMVTGARKRVVRLPDGSTVLLNKDSRLDYPRVFRDTIREVVLSGEAYFDITHLAGRPFIVHTGKLSTRVLGTAFNIRAYPGDKAIAITVTSGKVQVSNERAAVGFLTADQQMRYDLASATIVKEKVDVRPLVAWRPSEVSFDDITMEEAARRVGEWLGVTVHFVNPALKDCRVTASFYREDQLEEILTVLCAVNEMSYTIHDKDVSIDGRGCN
jgi:ferric-dicitrate binding protein FerR (iron transport regulator)